MAVTVVVGAVVVAMVGGGINGNLGCGGSNAVAVAEAGDSDD